MEAGALKHGDGEASGTHVTLDLETGEWGVHARVWDYVFGVNGLWSGGLDKCLSI